MSDQRPDLTLTRDDDGLPVRLRCSVVLIRNDNRLLIHRTDNPSRSAGGDWVFPGGNPRAGEPMQACAIRETAEETGMAVHVGRCLFVYEVGAPPPHPRVVELVFAAAASTDGQPQALEANRHAAFVPLEQVRHVNLRPPIAGHLRGLRGRAGKACTTWGTCGGLTDTTRRSRAAKTAASSSGRKGHHGQPPASRSSGTPTTPRRTALLAGV